MTHYLSVVTTLWNLTTILSTQHRRVKTNLQILRLPIRGEHKTRPSHGEGEDECEPRFVVVSVCLFVSRFAWSWGPLGWLIASEIFTLETRTTGYAFAVSSNMLFTFLIAQAFMSLLCQVKPGIFFFFFTAWIIIMALLQYFMLQETKGIPMKEMTHTFWKNHWYWKRFMVEDECELSKMEKAISP
ncbi:sugar transport protein 8-like [Dioscorea cayenensis subsp. rotundata]|uniref:Sugar transport protein 8-like n=1 Tax=Dioscorea cayennensis subsp. rotundata TaxID=55577 RepID=A0AB40CP83_DIOCR|nr:sugar transport protein 8-like [Dioscorea cayenensis subsp. rotundata]